MKGEGRVMEGGGVDGDVGWGGRYGGGGVMVIWGGGRKGLWPNGGEV